MLPKRTLVLLPALCAGLSLLQEPDGEVEFTAKERYRIGTFSPVPEPPPNPTNRYADDPAAAHLGRWLFFDTRFSKNGEVSCATCHDPAHDWTDRLAVSEGLGPVSRNAPTLWNVAHSRWQFWDGRADSLWAQWVHPLEDPQEMGFSRLEAAHLVHADEDLRAAYRAVFGELPDLADRSRFPARGRPILRSDDFTWRRAHPELLKEPYDELETAWIAMAASDREAVNRMTANLGKALEAYQRQLVSRDALFDRYCRGLREDDPDDLAALSPAAQRGLRLFLNKQCRLCHFGPGLTDNAFHNTGLAVPEDAEFDNGRPDGIHVVQADPFNGAGAYSDAPDWEGNGKLRWVVINEHVFGAYKTPTLRNVARTAPYMHDGRFETLEEVLRFYSELPGGPPTGHREETMLPANFTNGEIRDLVAFLESLTGAAPDPKLLRPPDSPVPPHRTAAGR